MVQKYPPFSSMFELGRLILLKVTLEKVLATESQASPL